VATGDWITLVTVRAAIEARALVTPRIRRLLIHGRHLDQVAIPFHWGGSGLVTGDCANDLVPLLGEPNVSIHEGKALLCAVWPGRRPPAPELSEILARLQRGEAVPPPAAR